MNHSIAIYNYKKYGYTKVFIFVNLNKSQGQDQCLDKLTVYIPTLLSTWYDFL